MEGRKGSGSPVGCSCSKHTEGEGAHGQANRGDRGAMRSGRGWRGRQAGGRRRGVAGTVLQTAVAARGHRPERAPAPWRAAQWFPRQGDVALAVSALRTTAGPRAATQWPLSPPAAGFRGHDHPSCATVGLSELQRERSFQSSLSVIPCCQDGNGSGSISTSNSSSSTSKAVATGVPADSWSAAATAVSD